MQPYLFCTGPNISWCLFANEWYGFSKCDTSTPSDISAVLSEVCRVFIDTFGKDTIKSHPVLSVIYSNDGPVCFREHGLIFLSSTQRYCNQHIYQFAHELCHFMVPGDVCDQYRWLEETLCETMSCYAINRIYESRSERELVQLSTLYDGMPGYIQNVMADRDDLHGESIASYLQRNLKFFQEEWYNRRKNRTIAFEIYLIFLDHPELWKIVPFLDQLKPDMALIDALRTLCGLADIPVDVGELFTQRLCEQPEVAPQ